MITAYLVGYFIAFGIYSTHPQAKNLFYEFVANAVAALLSWITVGILLGELFKSSRK